MNEADINLSWAGITLNAYMLVSIAFWLLMKPWDQCMEDAKVNKIKEDYTKSPIHAVSADV